MPDNNVTVMTLKLEVMKKFPEISSISKIKLFSNNVELKDNLKKVTDYGVDHTNYYVELRAPKIYRTEDIVGWMKTNGSWKYNKETVDDLELGQEFERWLGKTKEEDLAFTIVMFRFMKRERKQSEEELKLVYSKVLKFIKAGLGKL